MTALTSLINATNGGLPHVDVFEVPQDYIIRHRSHPRSKSRVIDTQSKDKIAFSKAHDDGLPPKSSYNSYSLHPTSISAAYIHAHIKRESNTRLYPLGTRGTKHEVVRAIRNGIEVHRRLYETGGFTCIVSPLNILSSKSGDFLFVDVENTHIVTSRGVGEHLDIKFDHTPFSVPFLSPWLMEKTEALKLKDYTPERANNACISASKAEKEFAKDELHGDKNEPKLTMKNKRTSEDRTSLVVYETESFFWTLVWALATTGEKSRWRCAELMYSPSFQDSFDGLFMNDQERVWSPDPKLEVLLHSFCLPPVLRKLALRWEMQRMSDIELPDPWVWMTIDWNIVLENLLKEFLFIQRHALLKAGANDLHHSILYTLDRALKKMPKGNMPACCELKTRQKSYTLYYY